MKLPGPHRLYETESKSIKGAREKMPTSLLKKYNLLNQSILFRMMEIGIENSSGTVSSAAVAAYYACLDLMGSLLSFKVRMEVLLWAFPPPDISGHWSGLGTVSFG